MVPPTASPAVDVTRVAPIGSETDRLVGLYARLRERLLDLSNRNPMLNTRFGAGSRSRRQLQIVNTVPDAVYQHLVGDGQRLELLALNEPDIAPDDERTDAFLSAFQHARLTDIEYLTAVAAIEAEGRDDELHLGEADEALRLRLRTELGLPDRPKRHEIARAEHADAIGINPSPDLSALHPPDEPLSSGLQTLRYPDELEEVLDRIEDAARLAAQETGMSTLFLAFGFLERTESDDQQKRFFAPLLLVPVKLEPSSGYGRMLYRLGAEGAAEINLSLGKLLERDFTRSLPIFEPGEDEAIGAIEAYFGQVSQAIDGLKGWRVRRWLVLGTFAYGRFALYNDLKPELWPDVPIDHPLVRAILAGTDRPGDDSADFGDSPDYDIDDVQIDELVPHLVCDADASQHSALVDVALGDNLVIEGPPGTGKSQTITNVIAHALGAGKRVLFLSEKQAALDVVRRRLDQAGLGPFCLELHSDKAVPKLMIEALKARADLGWGLMPGRELPPDPVRAEARQTINAYLDDLHTPLSDGETPFRLIWQSIRGQRGEEEMFEALKALGPPGDRLDDPDYAAAIAAQVAFYAGAAAEFEARHGPLWRSPWSRTGLKDIPAYDFLRLRAALNQWREPMLEAASLIREGEDIGLTTLEDLDDFVAIEATLGSPFGGSHLAAFQDVDPADAASILELMADIAALERRMAETPDLVLSPREATAGAHDLVTSRLGTALADRVPADLNRAIARRVTDAGELIAAIEGLMPALSILGLDRTLSADAFTDLAMIVRALAAMPEARRGGLIAFHAISSEDVVAARRLQADVREAGEAWKSHFPGLATDKLPDAGDVRAAAQWVRRGSVGRAIGRFASDGRQMSTLLRSLTGRGGGLPDAALLEQLADYIRFAQGFETDPAFVKRFGLAWRGAATPFDEIEAALALRRAFSHAMSQTTNGAVLAGATLSLTPSGLSALVGFAPAADRYLTLTQEMRARLKAFTLGSAIPHLEAEIRAAGALADLAGDPALQSLERPLGVIAAYHTAREELAVLRRRLDAAPLASDIARRLDIGDPAEALAGVRWMEEVRRSRLSKPAQTLLTSARAADVRAMLVRLAGEAVATLSRVEAIRTVTETEFGWFNLDRGDPAVHVQTIDQLIAAHGQLGDFLVLRRLKLELAEYGLGPFLDTAERLMVPMTMLPHVFATLVARSRADQLRRHSAFGASTGMELDVRRKIFAERDRARIIADRAAIRGRLLQMKTIPGNNVGPKSAWTEMALIRNEFAKSVRHVPIRALLARAPRSIQTLTPCFMMSPLSLAKFTSPGKLDFDLVVIDEASQMRPEDALGGLLRARQIIVVGDPKQLPPTDFFGRSGDDAGNDEDAQDIDGESILEFCARAFRRVRRLKWHYRSRCESLIAFSNREFYRDSLITFPSSRPNAFSIDLIRVNGTYRNRRNTEEAARVAEEAIRLMRHFAGSELALWPSLGIVALNMEQRDLIREELRRLEAGEPLVAAYRRHVADRGEPVFVKNLENVQGDERDFIFISLNRGPAPGTNVVAQNFGPIGGRHGARRLNVLFTRARMRVALFASLGSADVRPSETSGQGLHVLKRYLAYVEEQGREPVRSFGGEPESDFEIEVADRLTSAGFEVELQVGVSQYRIDLGVRHPDRPEQFLAGIECDGARYHSSKSARDRDRLREEVLRGLGWELIRVWSTDWFADPDEETRRLVRRLNLLSAVPVRNGLDYAIGVGEMEVSTLIEPAVAAVPEEAGPPFVDVEQLMLDLNSPAQISEVEVISPSETEGARRFEEAATPYVAIDEIPPMLDPSPLNRADLTAALIALRETRIRRAFAQWQPQRSILRQSMIETLIAGRVVDPDEWSIKVPAYLRHGTNAAEVHRFLPEICALVARLSLD